MAATPLLVPADLPAQVQDLYAAYLLLQTGAATIAAQPRFDLTLLPTLPEDQAVLQQHVTMYQQSVSSSMLGIFQELVTASNAVSSFAVQIGPQAAVVDQGTGSGGFDVALAELDTLLLQLQAQLLSGEDSSKGRIVDVCRMVGEFASGALADDNARFAQALEQVNDTDTVAQLTDDLSSLQSQIDSINSAIAKSATSEIPTAVEFGMAIGQAVTAELGVGLMVVSIAIEVSTQDSGAQQEAWEARYTTLQNLTGQYVSAVKQLDDLELQSAILQTIASQCSAFTGHLADARSALTAIEASMAGLAQGFGELQALDAPPSPGYFTDQIQQAVQFWSSLQQDCSKYLASAI